MPDLNYKAAEPIDFCITNALILLSNLVSVDDMNKLFLSESKYFNLYPIFGTWA